MREEIIIDEVTDTIISKIDPSFNKLQKIRFIYLELGHFLEKNITFFKNPDLGEYALSKKEFYDIYEKDKIPTRTVGNNTQYQIICKTAAKFLKVAFDKVGIESEYLRTTLGDKGIYHWFIVAKDDNDNQYFLTLAADLPYIKNNFPTNHFASDIRYLSDDGTPSYVLPKSENILLSETEDGVYEVAHKALSESELYEIDKSIGYERLYEVKHEDLIIALKARYSIYLEENSDVFKIFLSTFNAGSDHSFRYDDITDSQIEEFKKRMFDYISNNSKIPNDHLSNKDYLIYLLRNIDVDVEDTSLSFEELLNKYKKELRKVKDNKFADVIRLYHNSIAVCNNLYTVLEKKKELLNATDTKEINKLKIKLKRLTTSIRELIYLMSYYFIDRKLYTKDDNEYIPVEYVVRKFLYMFPVVFDCNYDGEEKVNASNMTVRSNNFSRQNYSEQIVIIKMLLDSMFSELSVRNCEEIEDYNYTYSPAENRIQTYPIIDRETKEYCIGFYFGKKDIEGEIYFIYIPSLNKLERRNPTEDYKRYYSVSSRFENYIKIEEIESSLNDNKIR